MYFVCCGNSTMQELFIKANKVYEQKKYDEAIKLYDSIDNKGPATWYNMGNCAFKLSKYVDAIIYWRKALKQCSQKKQADIIYNLSLAYKKLGYEPTIIFWSRVSEYLYQLSSVFSLLWLQILFLLFWFIFFITWFWLKRFRVVTFIFLLCCITILGSFVFVRYRFLQYPLGIVKEPAVQLFSGPDNKYHKIGEVGAAQPVRVKTKYGGWCKVKVNGLIGWIASDKVEII